MRWKAGQRLLRGMILFFLLSILLSSALYFVLSRGSPAGQTAGPLHAPSSQSLFQPMGLPFALLQLIKLLPLRREGVLGHLVLNVFLMAVGEEFFYDICELAILVNRFYPVLFEVLDEFGGRYECSIVSLSGLLDCSGQMTLLFVQTVTIEGPSQVLVILGQF